MANRFWARTGAAALLVAGMLVSAGSAQAAPETAGKGATRFLNVLETLAECGFNLLENLLRGLGVERMGKAGSDIDPNGSTTQAPTGQGGSGFDTDDAGILIDPFG